MIKISKGCYSITEKDGNLYFNDLRFGVLSLKPNAQNFVFQYKISTNDVGEVSFIEIERTKEEAKQLIKDLWMRVKGN